MHYGYEIWWKHDCLVASGHSMFAECVLNSADKYTAIYEKGGPVTVMFWKKERIRREVLEADA